MHWCEVDWRSRESRRAWMRARRETVYRQILRRNGVPAADTMLAEEVFAHERPVGCWSQREGPKHWARLHRRALSPVADPAAERAWLVGAYADGIGCVKCRAHWLKLIEVFPAPTHGPDDYFAWSVEMHNHLNVRLNKPVMTLEEARARWQTT